MKQFIFLLCLLMAELIGAQGTMLLRQPTLSDDQVVFVYADDLWRASRSGGPAVRLTSNEGTETNPHFSQDGQWIAFSAQYGGNMDVYVVAAEGGSPQRLTFHQAGDYVQGWTPEGEILFRSSRESRPTTTSTFFTVSPDGGFPQRANIPRAAYGEISPDGKYAAYTPITSWDPEWRNYRGGQAMPIWIQDMTTGQVIKTPRTDGERHLDPVWVGEKVYYLSERDYLSNIWSFDPSSGQEVQVTTHKVFDVKSLDTHGTSIVYEQGGYLHILDTQTGQDTQLEIIVDADMSFARERWEDAPARALTNGNLSPNGKRAIFEYRGDIFTAPKKNGSYRSLTQSSAVADRTPIWSPKGDRIAWFLDESGEYQLIIADQFGQEIKRLDGPSKTFYFQPDWSPDGKKIAFTDTHYQVWYVDIDSGKYTKVDDDMYAHPNRSMNPVWSPDSRYLAYAKQQSSHFKSAYIYDTQTAKVHHVVDGLADVIDPVFDQSGAYLYFLASTDYGLNSGWLDMSSYDPDLSRTLYAVILHADGDHPEPLKTDDEENESEDESEESEESDSQPIDFARISNRIVALSKVSGQYVGLGRAPEGHVSLVKSSDDGISIETYNVADQEITKYASDVQSFVPNYDGSMALWRNGGGWFISSLAGKPSMEDDRISTNFRVKVDPQAEYAQMLREGWRFMRDFLYVDNVHGAPWDQVWEWYSPWIKHVKHRSDLNYVVDILSGEVAIGHSYVYGGDTPDIEYVSSGLLGADFTATDQGYRIDKIYTGENWNPDLYAPLGQPGLDVKTGDVITSVNGLSLVGQNIYDVMQQMAGQHVRLGMKRSPSIVERIVDVKAIESESMLRTFDWIESNRRKVDELSDGQLAYVYVPNTGGRGFQSFNRYYFSQQHKKGAIIDERNNGGGSAADYMIDIMSRELFGYFNSRTTHRRPWTTPMAGIWGPKVMIINERAGSGGDLLPYMFKEKDLGPLVGTTTWGGLVGTWDTPRFIDGGGMVAPRGGFFDVDGEWAVEGVGVAPDIEVHMDPALVLQGQDPQLEKAVEEALRLLKAEPFEMKPEPAAPVRSKRPAGWNDK